MRKLLKKISHFFEDSGQARAFTEEDVIAFKRQAIRTICIFFIVLSWATMAIMWPVHPEIHYHYYVGFSVTFLLLGCIAILPRLKQLAKLWTVLCCAFFGHLITGALFDEIGIQSGALVFAVLMPVMAVYFIGSLGAIGCWICGIFTYTILFLYSLDIPPPISFQGGYFPIWNSYLMAIGAITLSLIIALTLHESLLRSAIQSRRSQEQAEASERERTKFFGAVSHEVRNTLNGIYGLTSSLLQEEDLLPDVRKRIELIQATGNTLVRTLNDTLDINRLQSNKAQLHFVAVNPKQIVHHAIERWRPHAEHKGIRLISDISENVPETAMLDDVRVMQIIDNLLSNAIKFTATGHVKIELDHIEEGDQACFLNFDVSDTGVGIQSDKVQEIFKAYNQGSEKTQAEFGGTGLGLYISKLFTEQMGGQIEVTKSNTTGTTFRLSLPCEVRVTHVSEQLEAAPPEEDFAPLEDIPVLIVDDHPANIRYFQSILESWGADISSAESGRAALSQLELEHFELMLIDLNMPGMNGCEVIAKLRGSSLLNANIPVIVVSADVSPSMQQDLRDLKVADILIKPLTPEMLLHALSRLGKEETEDAGLEIAAQ